jgi:hypothetical protein
VTVAGAPKSQEPVGARAGQRPYRGVFLEAAFTNALFAVFVSDSHRISASLLGLAEHSQHRHLTLAPQVLRSLDLVETPLKVRGAVKQEYDLLPVELQSVCRVRAASFGLHNLLSH